MFVQCLDEWLVLKEKQFHKMGYTKILKEDLKEYFDVFLWKFQMPATYTEQVYAIASLTPNQYFDFKTMQIQTQPMSLADLQLSFD